MIVVVDTSVFISAMINPANEIGEISLNPLPGIKFAAPDLLRTEYLKHRNKVVRYSKMDLAELREIEFILFDSISFLSTRIIPEEIMNTSNEIVRNIDIDDAVFVALTIYTEGKFWTLDKTLIKGLAKKGFADVLSTAEVRNKYSTL